MSNRKNQQSILVLATLGVYLGLVLIGATPQVLAQAAMTRQFSVKDEVEVKDDLDDAPPRSGVELEGYVSDTEKFLSSLRDLDLSPAQSGFDYTRGESKLFSISKLPDRFDSLTTPLGQFADSLAVGFCFADCLPKRVKGKDGKFVLAPTALLVLKHSAILYDLNKYSVQVYTALPRAALDPLLAS